MLGIGLSHQMVIENMFGLSFDKPVRHMREYLAVLMPLLHERKVDFVGETLRTNMGLGVTDVAPPPVLIAALGEQMLKLAGTMADGTVTWMTGPATLAAHTVPTITAAAEKAGRTAPQILTSLPVCVSNDTAKARESAARVPGLRVPAVVPSHARPRRRGRARRRRDRRRRGGGRRRYGYAGRRYGLRAFLYERVP